MFEPNLDRSPDRFRSLATAVAPAVLAADFDALRGAARRRRARRTSVVALAVVTGLSLAITAPTIVGFRPAQTLSQVTRGLLGDDYRSGGQGMVFVNASTGYRHVTRCPDPPAECDLTLEATADGGRTWQRRPVPRLPMQEEVESDTPSVDVIGPRSLLLIADGKRQKLSIDGGYHWTAPPTRSGEPVAAASQSDLVRAACPDVWSLSSELVGQWKGGCARPELVAINSATGVDAPLASQPPLAVVTDAFRGADGSVWAQGTDAAARPSAAVSRDGGQTWIARPIPGLEDGPGQLLLQVVTRNGRTAYALRLPTSDEAQELPIARTDDGGLTWHSLPRDRGRPVRARAIFAHVLPDGSLAVNQYKPNPDKSNPVNPEAPTTSVSSDGVTFERLGGVPSLVQMQAFPGGTLGVVDPTVVSAGTQIYVTTDGDTWRALPLWDTELN